MSGPLATDISVDDLLANLAALYGRQLAEANVEAARWKSIAQAQAGELTTLRQRMGELEAAVASGDDVDRREALGGNGGAGDPAG